MRRPSRQPTRQRRGGSRLSIWLLSACCFMLGCSQQFILGVPGQIADGLGVGLADIGLLMTAFGVANAVGTPLILAFTGRVDQRRLLLAGLAVLVVGLTVTALTHDYAVLVCARAMKGLGHGVFVATSYAIAQRLAEPGREVGAMADIALGFSLAQVLGMPIARLATGYVDWRWLYGALAVCAAASMAVVGRVIPSIRQDVSDTGALRALVKPFSYPQVRLALLATTVTQVGYMGFYTYITPFLETVFAGDGAAVSTVVLVMGVMCAVGTKASGPLSARFGARRTVLGCLLAQVAFYLAMLPLTSAPLVLAAVLCLWILIAWMFLPPQNLLLSRMAPEHVSVVIALSTSSLQLGGALGSAAGSLFIGIAPLLALPALGAAFTGASLVLEAMATSPRRP